MTQRKIPAFITVCLLPLFAAVEEPRLCVITDIGGDPDDQSSLVRLLTYANHCDIEDLGATPPGSIGTVRALRAVRPQQRFK